MFISRVDVVGGFGKQAGSSSLWCMIYFSTARSVLFEYVYDDDHVGVLHVKVEGDVISHINKHVTRRVNNRISPPRKLTDETRL